MNSVWFYASALTLVSLISVGSSLKCFTCQVIEGFTQGNPCQAPVECLEPATCLSATFSLTQQATNRKLTSTLRQCVPKTDGSECERIHELGKAIAIPGFSADFGGKCITCDNRDGCNGSSGPAKGSLAMLLGLSFATLLWSFAKRF